MKDYPYPITVILPVYNGIEFLNESVSSVLGQTFTNFEFIICDDCSTDESWNYLQQYKDSRIVLLRNEQNKGLFTTLNKMIRAAKGRLIKLWSQDDVMMPDCLQETVLFHEKYPAISFSYSDRYIINEKNEVVNENTMANDNTPEYISRQLHDKIAFYTGSIAGNIANVTMRKDAVEEVGFFDEGMRISADFDMWVRLTDKYDIGRIQKPLIQLRDHGNQLSRASKYYLLHMKEDWVVYNRLIQRNSKEVVSYGRYYLNWRKGPLYFSFMLQTLKGGKIKDTIAFVKEMSRHFSVPATAARWVSLKLFKTKIRKPVLE